MLEDASLVILNVFLLQILFHETNPSGLGIDIHAYVFSNTVSLSRSYSIVQYINLKWVRTHLKHNLTHIRIQNS